MRLLSYKMRKVFNLLSIIILLHTGIMTADAVTMHCQPTTLTSLQDLEGITLTFDGVTTLTVVEDGYICLQGPEGVGGALTFAYWAEAFDGTYTIEGNTVTLRNWLTEHEGLDAIPEGLENVYLEDFGAFAYDGKESYFPRHELGFTGSESKKEEKIFSPASGYYLLAGFATDGKEYLAGNSINEQGELNATYYKESEDATAANALRLQTIDNEKGIMTIRNASGRYVCAPTGTNKLQFSSSLNDAAYWQIQMTGYTTVQIQNMAGKDYLYFAANNHFALTSEATNVVLVESPRDLWPMIDRVEAKDTLSFTTTNVLSEPDPNAGKYNITLFSEDKEWRTQINYHTNTMYGSWVDEDFNLVEGGDGKNYNYIRPAKNDMVFYSYQTLRAEVRVEKGATLIDINGLIKDGSNWRRVLVHGIIPTVQPKDTVAVDLGHAFVTPNLFYQYYMLEGHNADYNLTLGIMTDSLRDGTYYAADLLMPVLSTAKGDTIAAKDATLTLTHKEGIGQYNLQLLSQALTLYDITFDDSEPEIIPTDTIQITCAYSQLSDYTVMYGIYQLYGENGEYAVSIGLQKEAVDNSYRELKRKDFDLTHTMLAKLGSQDVVHIVNANASIVDDGNKKYTLCADLFTNDAHLYQVSMPIGRSSMPAGKDTVDWDFGYHVGRVDYTQGLGYIGLVGTMAGVCDIHTVFYHGGSLSGEIGIDLFDYEGTYVTLYKDTIVKFIDVKMATAQLDSVGDELHIQMQMLDINSTLYRIKMILSPKQWLHGQDFQLDYTENVQMVAIQLAKQDSVSAYVVQFQHADAWTQDDEPIGDQHIFSFMLLQNGIDGISGEYGYSAGNLNPNYYHTIVEDSCEILLGPVAGTLRIVAQDEQVIPLEPGKRYKTHWYEIESDIMAENGELYHISGLNVLLCIDTDGQFVELSEKAWQGLKETLEAQGHTIEKIYRNGQVIIRLDDKEFTTTGQAL